MKTRIFASVLTVIAAGFVLQSAMGQHLLKHHQAAPPVCEPGYQLIEEIIYQDVVKQVCRNVPEYKKKWVYSMIDDPFCIQDSSHHHGNCEGCSQPYCRKLLVKREVLEPCPHPKCVIETIVEKVPCVVYKKVPIATFTPTNPGQAPKPAIMPPASNGTTEVIPNKPRPVVPGQK